MAALERTLVFIGFMGAGKTRAAQAAAAALGVEAADADELLERELGEPIAAIFERHGEAAFRDREERLALDLIARGGIVALGGGALGSDLVRAALSDHFAVWCRVSEETAWERATRDARRPLARDREDFSRRFAERQPLYESVARGILPEDAAKDTAPAAAPWLRAAAALPDARLVWARSASALYPAVVGEGALSLLELVDAPSRWFAIADAEALRRHGGLIGDVEAVLPVEAAEERKTLAEAERLLRKLAAAGTRRDDAVLAFGGGMVGDLAGFCAATYQRGVPVVQAPTTLVAQVDAAYGGKTGVDLPEAKNYVGAYHMPSAVLTDPSVLDTLPAAELSAGFAEVLKTALIAGGPLWERVRMLDSLDPAALVEVIYDCARTKLDVVADDERDAGRRAVLNLGHTVGHAIEAATGYRRYRHGEAVGLGLLATLRLSEADGLREEVAELLARHGLPVELHPAISLDDVLAALEMDKKRTAEGVGFVLLDRPGHPAVGRSVDRGRVRDAVEELLPAR